MSVTSAGMKQYDMYINGEFSSGSGWIEVENPSTRQIVSRVAKSSNEDVDRAVDAANEAQKNWARLTAIRRAHYLQEIAAGIRANKEHLAYVISEEQGKVLPLSLVEVEFSADYLDYMAGFARRYEGNIVQSDRAKDRKSVV